MLYYSFPFAVGKVCHLFLFNWLLVHGFYSCIKNVTLFLFFHTFYLSQLFNVSSILSTPTVLVTHKSSQDSFFVYMRDDMGYANAAADLKGYMHVRQEWPIHLQQGHVLILSDTPLYRLSNSLIRLHHFAQCVKGPEWRKIHMFKFSISKRWFYVLSW